MKICLLNPPKFQKRLSKDIIINFNVARFSRGVDLVYGTTSPTELAILAAEISKQHKVIFLDANASNMLPREINRWILTNNPDYLIIKCGDTTLIDDLIYYYFAEGIGVKTIVWEDMLNPIFSNELIKNYHVKRIMYGEPERVIFDFLNGKSGVIGGDFIPDLNRLPQPLFDKLPMRKYYKEGKSNWYSFLSRGCGWGKCEFCLMADKNIPHRLRSLDHIKEELDLLEKYKIKSIYFWDPQFNPGIKRAKQVSELLLYYNFKWECWFRCDNFDEELFKLMKKSGCFRIHIGLENASQMVLDSFQKGIKVHNIYKTINLAKKYDIECAAYMVLGTPEESKESFNKTIKFIKKAKPTTIVPASFRPFPNTPLTKRMMEQNFLKADHFSLSNFSNCFGFDTVSKTKYLTNTELKNEIEKIHKLSTKLAIKSYLKEPLKWKGLIKPFLIRTVNNYLKNDTYI